MQQAEKLPPGVRPPILGCAGNINGPGSHQGDQLMLIKRELLFITIVFLEVSVEPVRKRPIDPADSFTESSFAEGCSSTTRIVRNNHLKARISRTRPQRSLAKAGMANHGDLFCVDLLDPLKSIQKATKAPGPGRNRPPLVGIRDALRICLLYTSDAADE